MSIVAVIPALEINKYSPYGDLSPWGDSNLLEWKISQLKNVSKIDRIIVSTDSSKIGEIAHNAGIDFLKRDRDLSLKDSLMHVCSNLKYDDHILWTNPTSPFVGEDVFSALIKQYFDYNSPYDGCVTSRVQQEFLYTNDGPLNFNSINIISRDSLPHVHTITNGAYLSRCKNVMDRGRMFGNNPIFFEISWLASLEIREFEQMELFSSLMQKYFQGEL